MHRNALATKLASCAQVVYAFSLNNVGGNPAGVVVHDPDPAVTDEVQREVASIINHPETAFVERNPFSDSESDIVRCAIRWFTPSGVEVDLCGHATLAAAHDILRDQAHKTLILMTRHAGELVVHSSPGGYRMEFPEVHLDFDLREDMNACASFNKCFIQSLGTPLRLKLLGRTSIGDLVVVGQSPEDVENLLTPSVKAALLSLESTDVQQLRVFRGLIAVAKMPHAGSPYDFVSRFFAPHIGIEEDPCTGSAHCFLGPYMCSLLGKKRVVGRQLGPGGGGVVTCEALDGGRVALYGMCRS